MAYDKPLTNLSDNINEFRVDHNSLVEAVGDLDNLTTTVDSDIVGAISEVSDRVDSINQTELRTPKIISSGSGVNTIAGRLEVSDSSDFAGNVSIDTLVADSGTIADLSTNLLTAASAKISDLTNNRVVIAGTDGELEDDGNLTFNGNYLDVGNTQIYTTSTGIVTTGNVQLNSGAGAGNLTVNGLSTLNGGIDAPGFDATTSGVTISSTTNGFIVNDSSTLNGTLLVSDSSRFSGNLSVGGDLQIGGGLNVQGTVNFINSNQVDIGDNIIVLNGDVTGIPTENAGLEVERGSYDNVTFAWNETGNYWQAAYDSDANTAQIVTTGNTSIVTNAMLAGSITNAKLSNSSITFSDSATGGDNTTAISLGSTINFRGTDNEVNVVNSSGTFTIGLSDDVTIANDLTVTNDFTVNGNFQTTGTTSTTSRFFKVLDGNVSTGIPSPYTAGLKIDRGAAANYNFVYDDSANNWRWFDSDNPSAKNTFLTTDNISATSPLNVAYDINGNSTFSIDDATTSAKGAASFASADFSVSSGAVSIKTGGVSNTQLAGSIANSKLSNSSITINGTSVSLGGTRTLDTDDISQGTTNLYYDSSRTETTARYALSVTGSGSYTPSTGVIDIQGGVTSVNSATGAVTLTTDEIAQGSTNLYYDSATTETTAKNAISVTNASGDGSLSYAAGTGIITYTGPSASEVRAHFSGTSPVVITDGVISVNNATTSIKGIASFSSTYFSTSSGAVSIKSGGVSNDRLVNSSITINGSSVSLGGSIDLADSAGGLSNGFSSLNSSLAIGDNHSVSGDNARTTAFGHSSLNDITTGDDNTAIGYKTLENITTTHYNTALGTYAGNQLVSGTGNTAIGYGAMGRNATPSTSNNHLYNTAVGMDTLTDLAQAAATSPCDYNTAVGYGAGKEVGTNVNNIGEGADNTLIGALAGNSLQDGSDNTFVGRGAGSARTSGTNNVIVGADADTASTSGNNNIVIGRNAALSSANTSNEIVLGDTNIDQFRIPGLLVDVTGDQNDPNGLVVLNADGQIDLTTDSGGIVFDTGTEIVSPSEDRIVISAGGVEMIDIVEGATDYIDFVDTMRITAAGDLECENDIIAFSSTSISDESLKENIEVIPDALGKVESLKGVTFDWKDKEETSAGLIAQDVEKILPQAVKDKKIRDGEEFKALNYDGVVGLLVEAVKELSARVKELESK